jgi:ribose transport system substrate-binding protein
MARLGTTLKRSRSDEPCAERESSEIARNSSPCARSSTLKGQAVRLFHDKRSRIAAVVVAAGVTAAAAAISAPTSNARPSAKSTVYFIFTGYAYPYFAPMTLGVEAAAKHYPNLSIKVVNANNSASTEITDLDTAVAAGAQGIILNTIQESVTSAAQTAESKGIPVVTIDRDVSSPSARIAFIGDNDVVLGKEQTREALTYLGAHKIKKPWNVVILAGTPGSSTAIGRLNGAMSVLNPSIRNGSVKVVLNQAANFATADAQATMSTELAKTTNIQLVICANDAMALGAITALKDHGIASGKTLVVGADAQPESLDAIKAGRQLDTVTHSPYLEAFWAVEAMNNYLVGKVKPPTKFKHGDLLVPMTVVTKANVGKIGAWGTPRVIPPLPYGRSKAWARR